MVVHTDVRAEKPGKDFEMEAGSGVAPVTSPCAVKSRRPLKAKKQAKKQAKRPVGKNMRPMMTMKMVKTVKIR